MKHVISLPGVQDGVGGDHIFIIAEIGKNFIQTEEDRPISEYLDNAKKLIDAAALCGVDAVKFQTHELEDEWHPDITLAFPHFKAKDRFSWIKRNTQATPMKFWREVSDYAKSKGIIFFSTPMSRMAAEKLEAVNVPIWKLASGDVTDYLLIDFMIKTGKPIIISSGQMSLVEFDGLVQYIEEKGSPLSILYCVSKYPCPPEMFNIGTIEYLREKYPHMPVGFSDHCVDTNDPALAAVKCGAKIVEKHFSLSRDLWGADHKASLTPPEMKQLVDDIRSGAYQRIDEKLYYGRERQRTSGATSEFRPYFSKVLVSSRDISAGEIITENMLYAMRPAISLDGISAQYLHKVLGRKATTAISKLTPVKEEYFR